MGRRELPINPDAPVAHFAAALRQLRVEAGLPTYQEMATRARCSKTALSQAASGHRLPPLPIVLAFVRACGGSEEDWRRRWHLEKIRRLRERPAESAGVERRPETSAPVDEAVDEAPPVGALEPKRHWPTLLHPEQVSTPAELAAALRGLLDHSSLSYSELVRRSGGRLATSTISNLVTGRSLPTWDTTTTFLDACSGRLRAEDREAWHAAWQRARTSVGERASHALTRMPMADCDPYQLGVHRAYLAGEEPSLPTYVPRDLDPHLRAALRDARTRSGLIVLVGGSGAGKTRAAYEAVQAIVPDFGVLHPAYSELRTVPPARTVVWFDELARYLDSGELTAATMHAMLRSSGPVIVIGTLWPEQYHAYTALPAASQPDCYRQHREVLKLATVIDVPTELSRNERASADKIAMTDPRIAAALEANGRGLAQILAAGPHLIRRWTNAPTPAAAALIDAAVEAYRAEEPYLLTAGQLRRATYARLSPAQRAQLGPSWFEEALEYATTPVQGGVAALTPADVEMGHVVGYRVADYLVHHRTDEVPEIDPATGPYNQAPGLTAAVRPIATIGDPDLAGPSPHLRTTHGARPVVLFFTVARLDTTGLATTSGTAHKQRIIHPLQTTRQNLAQWRSGAGDPADAATAFAQLLDDCLRILGPDHPHTLTIRHNLAYWRGEAGDPADAATAFAQLLDDCLRILGPDHPRTLTTRHNLAYWRAEADSASGDSA